MIGWLIFGGIVLLIVFLLICSVRINIAYENELDYKVTYLFFRIYPTSEKAKARKKKKETRKKEKEQKRKLKQAKKNSKSTALADKATTDKPVSADDAVTEKTTQAAANGEKSTAAVAKGANGEKSDEADNKDNGKIPPKKTEMDFDYIMKLINSASPPVKRIISKIRVNNLYVDYVVGGADAAAVALKYGAVNAAVGVILGWLAETVRLHKKEIKIEANFAQEKSDIFVYCDIKLRLSTAIGCGIWLLWRFLKLQIEKAAPKKKKKRRKGGKPTARKQST